MSERLPMRDYTCRKKDCYHCQYMNRGEHKELTYNPLHTWTREQLELLTQHANKRLPVLRNLFPNRSREALSIRRSEIAKALGYKFSNKTKEWTL